MLVTFTTYRISFFINAFGKGQLLQLRSLSGVHNQSLMGPFVMVVVNGSIVPVDKVLSGPKLTVGYWPTATTINAVSVKQLNPSYQLL
jgi:hypothetical protein